MVTQYTARNSSLQLVTNCRSACRVAIIKSRRHGLLPRSASSVGAFGLANVASGKHRPPTSTYERPPKVASFAVAKTRSSRRGQPQRLVGTKDCWAAKENAHATGATRPGHPCCGV